MVVSPSWLPFFLQNPLKNNAAHAITAGRKKRTQRNNASTKAAAQNAKNAAYAKTQDATHAATKTRKNTKSAATKVATQSAKNKNPAQPNFSHAGFPDFRTITD